MSYDRVAQFYDLFGSKDDIDFFRDLALSSGPRALELGVGTARVAVELARAGISVTGIDTSNDMLHQAREKLLREPEEVRNRVNLVQQDMRHMDLDAEYDFIYSPAGGFQGAWSQSEQIELLQRVHHHLAPNGKLALAIWMPPSGIDYGVIKTGKPAVREDGQEVVRSWVWRPAEEGNHLDIDIFYEVYQESLLVEKYHVCGGMAMISVGEMRLLLERADFEIEEISGDYHRSEYSPVSEWLVVVAHYKEEG